MSPGAYKLGIRLSVVNRYHFEVTKVLSIFENLLRRCLLMVELSRYDQRASEQTRSAVRHTRLLTSNLWEIAQLLIGPKDHQHGARKHGCTPD